MTDFSYSRGSGQFDNTPDVRSAPDFATFRDAILGDRSEAKGQGWIAGAFAVAPDDEHHRASPAKRRAIGKPHRCSACAQPRAWLGLDVDGGLSAEPWAFLVQHLQRYEACAYTTASSKPDAPRARIVIALDMPAPRDALIQAHKAMQARLSEAMKSAGYDAPAFDPGCDKPEQPLYLPLEDAQTFTMDGAPVCLAELPAPVSSGETPNPRVGGANTEQVRQVLSGENLHDATRNLAFRLVDDGLQAAKAVSFVRGIMEAMPDRGDQARWQARYSAIPRLVREAQEKVAAAKPKPPRAEPPQTEFILPPLPEALAEVPGSLGQLQGFILGTMSYPCPFTAGWTAIATMTAFAQTHITIDSQAGLGFNEYYLTLAPTGFGKEALRDPLTRLAELVPKHMADHGGGNLAGFATPMPSIEVAPPSSKQGLHSLLEQDRNKSVYVQSDEFAEWLKNTGRAFKKDALAYMLEVYSKALRSVHPGHISKTNQVQYETVQRPRLSVFATTTAESVLTALNRDDAEMGAYNRFLIFVAPEQVPAKRYSGMCYSPDESLLESLAWLLRHRKAQLAFTPSARDALIKHDRDEAEPIRRKDGLMGGRLAEQAIKLAGLMALAEQRLEIDVDDVHRAFAIRLGLYQRCKAMLDQSGAVTGQHQTGKALDQIAAALERRGSLYLADLKKYSRAYEKLTVPEQAAVRAALIDQGRASRPEGSHVLLHQEP